MRSKIWSRQRWIKALQLKTTVHDIVGQRVYGLTCPAAKPVRKPTVTFASDPCLLRRLNKRCDRSRQRTQVMGAFKSTLRAGLLCPDGRKFSPGNSALLSQMDSSCYSIVKGSHIGCSYFGLISEGVG